MLAQQKCGLAAVEPRVCPEAGVVVVTVMAAADPAPAELPGPLNEVALALQSACKRTRREPPTHRSWRPSKMSATAETLPIDAAKQEILGAVQSADVTVVRAETGSGKSTRVPQYLLDEHVGRGARCHIVVTVQRRIAATELARRVAHERGEELCPGTKGRTSVGYWIRGESALPYDVNSIVYATEGKFVQGFDITEFTHIIIDEAHERTRAMDMLLMMWKHSSDGGRPKLLLMTAGLSMSALRTYFVGSGDGAVQLREIVVPGRRFPVRDVYASTVLNHSNPEDMAPHTMVRAAVEWCWQQEPGTVLVFLADATEINGCRGELASLERAVVCPLHGKSPADERREALTPAPHGRKVILSTNVAETSITIPDVIYVVDFLVERLPPLLKKQSVSKASHVQRAGRAGRCGRGCCLTMSSEAFYLQLADFREPESVRVPMHAWALYALGTGCIESMEACGAFFAKLPSPPGHQSVVAMAKDFELWEVTVGGRLTVIGEHVSRMPCSIEVALALLSGAFLGVGPEVAMVLAAACTDGFFREFSAHHKEAFVEDWSHQHRASDLFAAGTFLEWHLRGCVEWGGNPRIMEAVLETLRDYREALDVVEPRVCPEAGGEADAPRWLEEVWPQVQFAICSGFRLQCAVHGRRKAQFWGRAGDVYNISRESVVPPKGGRAVFFTGVRGSFMQGVTTATALDVLVFGGRPVVAEPGHLAIGGWLKLEWPANGMAPAGLMNLRQTFTSLLGAFLQGSSAHDVHAQRFSSMELWTTTPASCVVLHKVVPLVAPEPAPGCPVERGTDMGDAAYAEACARCRTLPPVPTVMSCRVGGTHKASGKDRRDVPKYAFFQAVSDGCLACVRRELEVTQHVSPAAASENMGYTARDFADYACQQGVAGALEVQQYLDAHWSCIPRRVSGKQGTGPRSAVGRSAERPGTDATPRGQPHGSTSSGENSAAPAVGGSQSVSGVFDAARAAARTRCSLLPPISMMTPCRKQGVHNPKGQTRRDSAAYVFFQAVSDGCLACVRRELEETLVVCPEVMSDTNSYTARDFANYASGRGVKGAPDVKQYLDTNWSYIPVSA